MEIKKGDIVGRKSYNSDIFFIVDRIIKLSNQKVFAILKGITSRIEADAPIQDLKKIDEESFYRATHSVEEILNRRIEAYKNNNRKPLEITGKILHLDGDRKYSEKSFRYYNKIGLNAVVKNIAEPKQPKMVKQLLEKYKPEILIITGHDSMLKNGTNYTNLYNYRNSKYFIEAVRQARQWQFSSDKLFIFARSMSKLLWSNNGSSVLILLHLHGRILIDFIDPLIIAEKIATTDSRIFIRPYEISKELKEGELGVSGIGARGKKRMENKNEVIKL